VSSEGGNIYVYGERVLQSAASAIQSGSGIVALKAGGSMDLDGLIHSASGGVAMEAPSLRVDGTVDGGRGIAVLSASEGSITGSGQARANRVGLTAQGDIGSANDLFDVNATVLAARTGDGDIFLKEEDDVRTGDVSAPSLSGGLPPCVNGEMPIPSVIGLENVRSGNDLDFHVGGSLVGGTCTVARSMALIATGDIGAEGNRVRLEAPQVSHLKANNAWIELANVSDAAGRSVRIGTLEAGGLLDVDVASTGSVVNANGEGSEAENLVGQQVRVRSERLGTWSDPLRIAVGDEFLRLTSSEELRKATGRQTEEGYPLGYVWAHLEGKIAGEDSGRHIAGFGNGNRLDYPLAGLLIWNGAVIGGPDELVREIWRTEAFYVETPELKARQGIFGSPYFLNQYLEMGEGTAMGLVEYVLFGETWVRVPDREDRTALLPTVSRKGEKVPMPQGAR
jgi:hypothetical protein